MIESSPYMKAFAEAAAQYQLAKNHAEGLAADVASLSARVWIEELNRRFPDVTFMESDQIIEIGFGTDPGAVVALIEQLKTKGLQLDHVQKDPYGLRLCCSKVQEGTEPAPRVPIVAA